MSFKPSPVVVACLGMATFGIVLTTLGASLPGVMSKFGIDKAQAGALLSLLTFGVLAGSLVFGPIVDARGHKNLLVFAFATIIVGLEATAFAPSIGVLRGAVALIGFSGGLLNGAANALTSEVSEKQRAATLTFVGAFFGVGAAGVPLLMATLSQDASQAMILGAIAPAIVLPLVLTAMATFPASKQPHGFLTVDQRRLLRDRPLHLMGLILFLQSGVETTVGGWTTTFFAEELRVSPERAPLYLSLFWFGMMVTRLSLGIVLQRAAAVRVVLVSIAVSVASALLLVSSQTEITASLAVFLLGCGFAATFPVIFAFIGDRYVGLSGTAIGMAMVMALVGGMFLPYVAGVLGGIHGMRASLLLVPMCLLVQATLLPMLARVSAPGPQRTERA